MVGNSLFSIYFHLYVLHSNTSTPLYFTVLIVIGVALSYGLLEVIFQLLCRWQLRMLQKRSPVAPYPNSNNRAYIKRVLDLLVNMHGENSSEELKKFLSGWCLDAPFDECRKGNVEEFLAWAMWGKDARDMDAHEAADVNVFFDRIERDHDVVLPPGYNDEVRCARLSLEDVEYIPRPLPLYIVLRLLHLFKHLVLVMMGFRKRKDSNGTKFYERPGCGEPLLFLHGIAPAQTLFYLPLLFFGVLSGDTSAERPVIIIENKTVGMQLHPTPPSEKEVVDCVEFALRGQKATLLSHSLGSCAATWIVREHSSLISKLVLLDPVTIYLSLPAVAVNFVYSKPSSFTECVIYFFASTEMHVNYYLKRHFWWYRNELWISDIPDSIETTIVLSKDDEIVPSAEVKWGVQREKELARGKLSHVNVIELEGHHGAIIYNANNWNIVRDAVREKTA